MIIDRYAHLKSPIHRWHQAPKLVGLLLLIFTFACVEKLQLLPPMFGVTIGLYSLSRLPWNFLLERLRYPGFFILAVVLVLPLVEGKTVLWQWEWFALKLEGCLAVLLIVTRFLCILTVSIVLFGTAPFVTSLKAMKALGLPKVLVDMALLTYRYLEDFGKMRLRMQQAMGLRGFKNNRLTRRNLERLADLMGTLLVRSYDQSKRVYQAMILRGYGRNLKSPKTAWQEVDRYSWGGLFLTGAIACFFLLAEFWLS